jgi:signal transduction histidine kinase
VAVHDSGRGIDTPHQTRIFDAFYQGNASRSNGGAGLGLSIVSRVLELHQSEIKVESTFGQGACFYFELPLLTMDELH